MKYKWFVGIDISKATLDVTLYCQNAPKHIRVDNCLKGFKEILQWFRKMKIKNCEVIICAEHTGVYGLDFFVYIEEKKIAYSVVSPLEIKRSIGINRGKNDKVDSYKISRYCYLHSAELKESSLPSKQLQNLKLLLNERMRLVKMQTMEKQTMTEFKQLSSKSASRRSNWQPYLFTNYHLEIFHLIFKITTDIQNFSSIFQRVIRLHFCNLNFEC